MACIFYLLLEIVYRFVHLRMDCLVETKGSNIIFIVHASFNLIGFNGNNQWTGNCKVICHDIILNSNCWNIFNVILQWNTNFFFSFEIILFNCLRPTRPILFNPFTEKAIFMFLYLWLTSFNLIIIIIICIV